MSPVRDSCSSSMMRITFFDIDDDRLESLCLVFIVTHPHTPSDKCSGPSSLSPPTSHLQAGIPKLPSPHTPINGRIKPKLAIRIILPLQPPQPLHPPFLISIQLLRLLMPKPVIHIPPRRLLGPVRPGHDTLNLHGRRNDVVAPRGIRVGEHGDTISRAVSAAPWRARQEGLTTIADNPCTERQCSPPEP